ncbi:hypothetical protein JTB14_001456 [Gonioctena quinquepunctata]|nr:hypothetical protein JTB14_001456 [Gonioctena quinquepunctata]
MTENLNITFPDILQDDIEHSPAWSVLIPVCNENLTINDKSNTNPNSIRNSLGDIMSIAYSDADEIFTAVVSTNTYQFKLFLLNSIQTVELFAIYQCISSDVKAYFKKIVLDGWQSEWQRFSSKLRLIKLDIEPMVPRTNITCLDLATQVAPMSIL